MTSIKTETPEYKIIGIHMEPGQTRISKVKYETADTPLEEKILSTEEAISWMKDGKCKFYTVDQNGEESDVDGIDAYIRAKRDGTPHNNLLGLPRF